MASLKSGTLKQVIGVRAGRVVLTHNSHPVQLSWTKANRPAQIVMADGTIGEGACIRCADAPCIQYREVELNVAGMPAFPGDLDSRVCPTNAISWPTGDLTPAIEADKCIGCGLCVRRCPVGAIHFSNGSASLSSKVDGLWKETGVADITATAKLAAQFAEVPRLGACEPVTDTNIERFQTRLLGSRDHNDAQYPNHIARNLLLASGFACTMRRRGDVNARMDLLIGYPRGVIAVGEVEGDPNAMIDTPRNILDDAAVMLSRYSLDRSNLGALIVGFGLPNQRSEYWQIVEDIAAITGLKINTVSIAALVMGVWTGQSLRGLASGDFYTGNGRTIRPAVEASIGHRITLPSGFLGILESQK